MSSKVNLLSALVMAALLLAISACSQEPAEIHYANDKCAHCKMMITDKRFASQLITEMGKAYKFDAIECMAAYHQNNSAELEGTILYVSNYNEPGQWLNAKEAQFVKSEVVSTPMAKSLLAFPTTEQAQEHISENPGELLQWEQVSQTDM